MASSPKEKPVAITGGSGFLGTRLAQRLLDEGTSVVVIDVTEPEPSVAARAIFRRADIADREAVAAALTGCGMIYHLAAIVPISKQTKQGFLAINVAGTEHVLEAALQEGAKVVFCSTSTPLYTKPGKLPVNELTPKTPGYFYGKSKFAAEEICQRYREKGLAVAIVRPRMIIGPGRLGLLEMLFGWIRDGKPVPLLGSGDNLLQFLDVDDLADLLCRLGKADGERFSTDYNVGAKSFSTVRADIGSVIERAGSPSKIVAVPRLYRPFLLALNALNVTPFSAFHINTIDQEFYFDTSKAEQNLGWKSVYSNAESLGRSYDWYVANIGTIQTGAGHNKRMSAIGLASLLPPALSAFDRMQAAIAALATFLATGLGLSPLAPVARGTVGSLLALPLIPAFLRLSLPIQGLATLAAILVSIGCASIAEKRYQKKDDSRIVIDEFASMFVTFIGIGSGHLAFSLCA
ncbi:MAG TPA: phosphatidylglycerophosphatase A, partial [Candidatus Paceibacterota bacterium]|nr:phosphatidylglycerophosphatase A [Candidatus Paceibacterota bacterium]